MAKLLTLSRIALGLLFVVAGASKLVPPESRLLFEMAVSAHRIVPVEAVPWIGWLLPLAEVVLGVVLVVGWKARVATAAAALLLFLFTGFLTSAYFRGIQSYCGCFGFGEPIRPWTLGRDGLLFLLALVLTVATWRGGRRHGEVRA